jgi:hypothetical protein
LVVGSLGLIGIDEKTIGEFQKAAVSAIAFADGAKRVFEGYKEITEAKKIFSAITKTETAAQAKNTAATVAGTAATNTANTATKALNTTILKNPYVIAAAAVAALAAGIYLLVKAQKEDNIIVERSLKLREQQNELLKQQKIDNNALVLEYQRLGKTDLEVAQASVDALRKRVQEETKIYEFLKRNEKNSQALADQALKTDKLNVKFKQAKLRLTIEQKKAQIEADKQAIEDGNKAADESVKNSERIAIAAAKQLEAEKIATQGLIDLYEQFPEFIGERNRGQIELNTELDKTNFQLQTEVDLLMSLAQMYPKIFEDFVYRQQLATMSVEEFNDELKILQDELNAVGDGLGESFFSEDQLAVFKKLRDAQKTGLQLQLEDLENTYKSDLALFTDNEEMKTQITEQYEADRAKTVRQYAIQNAQAVLGITSQFLNTIAQVNQANLELQLAQAAGNQAAIDQINADALEQQKKLRIAQVYVTTAESILNGFNATSTLPPPFNFIAGAALAAAYGALGFKTVQTINATTLEGGGGGGGFNNIPSGGGFSLPGGGGVSTTPSTGALLPGMGGGFVAPTTIGTVAEPIRAYVLSGDVSNGMQAGIALNNRRRLSGG